MIAKLEGVRGMLEVCVSVVFCVICHGEYIVRSFCMVCGGSLSRAQIGPPLFLPPNLFPVALDSAPTQVEQKRAKFRMVWIVDQGGFS